jgi:hypothetical protein
MPSEMAFEVAFSWRRIEEAVSIQEAGSEERMRTDVGEGVGCGRVGASGP